MMKMMVYLVRQDSCRQPGDDDDDSGDDDGDDHGDHDNDDNDDEVDDVLGQQARVEQATQNLASSSSGPLRQPVFLRSASWHLLLL